MNQSHKSLHVRRVQQHSSVNFLLFGILLICGTWKFASRTIAQDDVVLQHRWEFDPDIGSDWTIDESRGPRLVDVALLDSPHLQNRVSEARRAQYSQRHEGVTNPGEAFAALVARLRIGESNRQATLALTAAAVDFASSKEDMAVLWEVTAQVAPARSIVERDLAKWKCDLALALWRERVRLGQARSNEMLIAIEGLAAVGSSSDRGVLETVLRSDNALTSIKLAAAKALGILASSGLEQLAREVLGSDLPQKELVAAYLVVGHPGEAAQALREELLQEKNPIVQSLAYRGIAQHDSQKAREFADLMLTHPDNTMRLAAIMVLDQSQDLASLNLQASLLSDANPRNRQRVRANLERKAANPELREAVRDIITAQLSSSRYEGIEQAILLAVALEEYDRSPVFFQLLKHPRPEVFVRAAWALQRFPLSPELLTDILAYCEKGTDRIDKNQSVQFEEFVVLAFLFEAIGLHAHAPANDMLMKYVPKDGYRMGSVTRTSAIYALGQIWKGSMNTKLSKQLIERLLDDDPMEPEDEMVKYSSAIAAGRIGDKSALKGLGMAPVGATDPIGLACHWAIEQLNQAQNP